MGEWVRLVPLPTGVMGVPYIAPPGETDHRVRDMVKSTSALPWLVNKADTQSELWNYFAYNASTEGKLMDTTKPFCKRCFKPMQTNQWRQHIQLNKASHRNADVLKEFKERLVCECDNIITCPQNKSSTVILDMQTQHSHW